MLLGIFSDSHLGFGGDDRYEESFSRFSESIELFKSRGVDFILHAGDLFDEATPNQEVWLKTFECFSKNNNKYSDLAKTYLGEKRCVCVKGLPIIAIHGTHEFRGKDFANALDVLEESNCLVHLHAGHVELEKNGERVFVHGLGGIPEKHAKDALKKYNPKPISGGVNVLLLHQSFTEYLPFAEDDMIATLSLSDLPDGFDLIIDGHLHWTQEQKIPNKRFLLTGSAIFTQMKKLESEHEKGVFLFDTKSKGLDFIPFKVQRKLFYEKINFKDAKPEDVMNLVNDRVKEILSQDFKLKPLIRIKVGGSLAKGFTQSDIVLDFSRFSDKAIFSISKNFSVEAFKKHIESLKELQSEKKSINEFGLNILERNLEEANLKELDARRLFELLSNGEMEKAENMLVN
jgi:DNA repair exonuclease SbcCD nuclease subunit